MVMARGLGEVLVREKVITADQLNQVLRKSKASGEKFSEALISQGFIDEQRLMEFFAKQYSLPIMDLSTFQADAELGKLVPSALCQKHQFIPIGKRNDTLVVAVADPTNV